MKKYVISLDKDQKRRELFFSQADTQDFQVFSALNTMNENWENLAQRFNIQKFHQHYARDITQGEIGCTLSHLAVYQEIATDPTIMEEDFCLICEDDALFIPNFLQELNRILSQPISADLLLVGQSKINTFNDIELEINYPTTFSFLQQKVKDSRFSCVYPYKNYFAGTVAYLIKKSAAKSFLEYIKVHQVPFWLADDFILFEQLFKLDILIVRPLMVIENPKLVSNLQAIRGSEYNNIIKKLIKYPLKKTLAVYRNIRK